MIERKFATRGIRRAAHELHVEVAIFEIGRSRHYQQRCPVHADEVFGYDELEKLAKSAEIETEPSE
jgi:hypothetical protein